MWFIVCYCNFKVKFGIGINIRGNKSGNILILISKGDCFVIYLLLKIFFCCGDNFVIIGIKSDCIKFNYLLIFIGIGNNYFKSFV